tara:strand:- start:297 stop:719 length:423 start_codon:yes stop_codon:yes gene_type:complete
MAATVYNLNCVGGASSGTLLNHQNTSGGNQRVIINFIRLKNDAGNAYIDIHFGSSSSGPNGINDCKVAYCNSFGKNVAYATQLSNSQSFNDQNWQGHSGGTATTDRNAPTEIMLANNEYFKILWTGSDCVIASNIVVIPE